MCDKAYTSAGTFSTAAHCHVSLSPSIFNVCFYNLFWFFFFYFLLEDQEDEIGDDYKEFGMSKITSLSYKFIFYSCITGQG